MAVRSRVASRSASSLARCASFLRATPSNLLCFSATLRSCRTCKQNTCRQSRIAHTKIKRNSPRRQPRVEAWLERFSVRRAVNKTRCQSHCPCANKNKLTSAAAASNAARSSASTSSSCSRCAALARALTPLLSDRSGMMIDDGEWEEV